MTASEIFSAMPDDPDTLALMRHELFTPLNAILGFSDLLASTEQLGERHRRYAANIRESGRILFRRINSLLEQARSERLSRSTACTPGSSGRFDSAA